MPIDAAATPASGSTVGTATLAAVVAELVVAAPTAAVVTVEPEAPPPGTVVDVGTAVAVTIEPVAFPVGSVAHPGGQDHHPDRDHADCRTQHTATARIRCLPLARTCRPD